MTGSSPQASSKPWRLLALGACALALVCAAYANHFNNPFEFDDSHTVENNLAIRDLANIPRFFRDATTTSSLPANQAYRPGVTTMHAVDFALGRASEPQPWAFHRTIFLSFLLLCALCFLLFKRVFDAAVPEMDNSLWALCGATLFGVLTANAETINYVSARSDSASTLLVVLALVVRFHLPRARAWGVDLLCMAVGFLVKEPAVMFVPLAGLYAWLFEAGQPLSKLLGKEQRPALAKVVKTLVPAALVAVALILFSRAMTPATWRPGNPDGLHYVATQPFVVLHYVLNFLLPFNLAVDTDWVAVPQLVDDRVFAGLLFVAAMLVLAWRAAEVPERRPIAFGLLWFLITLLPTSLMPLGEVLNDHRPFFGHVGLVMALVWTWALWMRANSVAPNLLKQVAAWAVPLLLFTGHAWGVHQRNALWGDEVALWEDTTRKAPNQGRNHMNYAVTLMKRARYREAEAALNRTLQLLPDYSYAHVNMGIVDGVLHKDAAAEAHFKRALELDPNVPDAHGFYAEWLRNQGRHEEALLEAKAGLVLSPGHARLLQVEAQVTPMAAQAAANQETRERIKRSPTADAWVDLSLAYHLNQQYPQAVEAALEALKLDPTNAPALNNICAAFNRLGSWDDAVDSCQRALVIKPDWQLARNNLAEAQKGKAETP